MIQTWLQVFTGRAHDRRVHSLWFAARGLLSALHSIAALGLYDVFSAPVSERRLAGGLVRAAARERVIAEIWRNRSAPLHPSAAPLFRVRFEGEDIVLDEAIGDGDLRSLLAASERRGHVLPLPVLLSLRAALVAGATAIFHADFRGMRLPAERLLDAVVLFGGKPRVRLSAFEEVEDDRLRANDLTPAELRRLIAHCLGIGGRGFAPGDGRALPRTIVDTLARLDRTGDIEVGCAAIRDALKRLVGGAVPLSVADPVCGQFTPWGNNGTYRRQLWERHLDAALSRLGAHHLVAELEQRRAACEQEDAIVRARCERPLADLGSETRGSPANLAALELLRERGHEPEPWLLWADSIRGRAPRRTLMFAGEQAVCAARGGAETIESVLELLGLPDERALARAFRAARFDAVADWLLAA